jgi:hypothetical protein
VSPDNIAKLVIILISGLVGFGEIFLFFYCALLHLFCLCSLSKVSIHFKWKSIYHGLLVKKLKKRFA